jgi:hypothetical protein
MTTCHKGVDGDGLVVRGLPVRAAAAWAQGQTLNCERCCLGHDNGDRLGGKAYDRLTGLVCLGQSLLRDSSGRSVPAVVHSSRKPRLAPLRVDSQSCHDALPYVVVGRQKSACAGFAICSYPSNEKPYARGRAGWSVETWNRAKGPRASRRPWARVAR